MVSHIIEKAQAQAEIWWATESNNYTTICLLCQLIHYTNAYEIGQVLDIGKVSPVQLILLGNAVITVIVTGHVRRLRLAKVLKRN